MPLYSSSSSAGSGESVPTSKLRTRRVGITLNGGASSTFEIIWTSPFANTSYTAVVSVQEGAPVDTLRVDKIQGVATDRISVRVTNTDTLQSRTGTLHAIAFAD